MLPFDKIYVISLSRRFDRLEYFYKNLPHPWIFGPIEVFDAVDGQNCSKPNWWKGGASSWGCYQSHYSIIKMCLQDTSVNNILIFEDDAVFCEDFNSQFTKVLENIPNDWDMLYVGGQHLKKPKDTIINNTIGIGTNINRTHAYGLSKQGMVKLNKLLERRNWIANIYHIDHHYGYLQQTNQVKAYCSLGWLVGQSDSWSDIADTHRSLRWW